MLLVYYISVYFVPNINAMDISNRCIHSIDTLDVSIQLMGVSNGRIQNVVDQMDVSIVGIQWLLSIVGIHWLLSIVGIQWLLLMGV